MASRYASAQWISITLTLFIVFAFQSFGAWAQEDPLIEAEKEKVVEEEAVEEMEMKASPSVPVTYREKVAFHIFYDQEDGKESVVEQASQASTALEKALTAETPFETTSPLVEVIPKASRKIEVRVRGYKVVDLNVNQQLTGGFDSLKEYQDQLMADLSVFVANELRRLEIQASALKFFLAIFFAFIGFIVVRQIHQGFNNAELMLEQKRESFNPVVVLSETLISGQALGGLLAFSLAIGRMLAYIIVVLTTIAAILGQFTISRAIMVDVFSQTFSQLMNGVQSLLVAIPGLLLALLLYFCLQLALKILDLFLRGARSGRISLSFLTPSRVPTVRFWGTVILIIFFGPLIVASVFGRFHTPIEIVLLLVALVFALASLPVLLSIAAGSFILWQGIIKPGQWIEIGSKSGEIANVSIYKVTIVPEVGGRIYIPMILFLFKACFEKKEAPKAEFQLRIRRKESLKNTKSKLESLFPGAFEVTVTCLSISSSEFLFALYAPQFQRDIRTEVLNILSEAHESGHVELTDDLIKEVRH